MCGIAGFSGDFQRDLLARMNRSLAHRGPDDDGNLFLADRRLGLVHRRLSIIDLTDAGHQPMEDLSGTATITFNGEIFNYKELRAELVEGGTPFRSHSDTEVLLNLYLRDGVDMLTRLNGMYAFALWDDRTRSLFLARDGVGVKPLYFCETAKGFLFASEMKALLQEADVDRTLDPHALHYHLTYQWCPAPHTMLRSVRKLEPGCALLVQDGRIRKHWRFYDLPYDQAIEPMTEEDAAERVRSALATAVERQMVADVPVGAFLSGGLDSSAIVAFARRFTSSRRLQCFTIGFKDDAYRREGFADDERYARRVAEKLDVDLHTIHVGPEMAEQLERMIYHLDEPQPDPAPLNVLFISQLARENGIKVLLSGAGGDDIFTGYRRHYALQQERLWSWMPRAARRALAASSRRVPTGSPLGRRIRKAFQYAAYDGDERIVSYFFWTDPKLQLGLYGPALRDAIGGVPPATPLLATLGALPATTPALNRMLYLEGKHFLPDHNLNYTDKMAMARGVEVRVPLLDPDLIALAARLPISLKQRGSVGKWIFKKAMEPLLPRDVIYRPKTGFGAPLRHWLRNDLAPMVEDVLSATALRRRGLFDPEGVRRLVDLDRAGEVDGAYTIFTLVCIELWCRIFTDVSVPEHAAF